MLEYRHTSGFPAIPLMLTKVVPFLTVTNTVAINRLAQPIAALLLGKQREVKSLHHEALHSAFGISVGELAPTPSKPLPSLVLRCLPGIYFSHSTSSGLALLSRLEVCSTNALLLT